MAGMQRNQKPPKKRVSRGNRSIGRNASRRRKGSGRKRNHSANRKGKPILYISARNAENSGALDNVSESKGPSHCREGSCRKSQIALAFLKYRASSAHCHGSGVRGRKNRVKDDTPTTTRKPIFHAVESNHELPSDSESGDVIHYSAMGHPLMVDNLHRFADLSKTRTKSSLRECSILLSLPLYRFLFSPFSPTLIYFQG